MRARDEQTPRARRRAVPRAIAALLPAVLAALLVGCGGTRVAQHGAARPSAPSRLLALLGETPSAESLDYVRSKQQFQLHGLLTEQRHPATWNLDERVARDMREGLRLLLAVDDDVAARLREASSDPAVARLASAFERAIRDGRRIYVYGCGATGRLAKQMESTFWRPFWRRLLGSPGLQRKLAAHLSPRIEDQLVGEMTGADRALISSLEGFEDLQLIGRLQLRDHQLQRGDVVVAVTEGGETSSVIGTVLAALEQWRAAGGPPAASREQLFFVYNNPDERLRPLARSRRVLDEPGITRINLTTGPQAIAGSTRMQATTIETFVIGAALAEAVRRVLVRLLTPEELAAAGFADALPLREALRSFPAIQQALREQLEPLARLATLEAETYRQRRFSTTFAARGLLTVFIDATERSPTFRLRALDTVEAAQRACWIQVWTAAASGAEAWQALLGRPFRGLQPARYQRPFEREIADPYLRRAALESLARAGDEQQRLYDFSTSPRNRERRMPAAGDLALLILLSPDDAEAPGVEPFAELGRSARARGARVAQIVVGDGAASLLLEASDGPRIVLRIPGAGDPFGLRQQVGLKMLLNALSTAVMARLGRVVGNTMTSVSPSNLKLIGRATFLVQSHVNAALRQARARGGVGVGAAAISYAEANAVLFAARRFLAGRSQAPDQPAEVALAIVRVLESLRRGRGVPPAQALQIVEQQGLRAYLAAY